MLCVLWGPEESPFYFVAGRPNLYQTGINPADEQEVERWRLAQVSAVMAILARNNVHAELVFPDVVMQLETARQVYWETVAQSFNLPLN